MLFGCSYLFLLRCREEVNEKMAICCDITMMPRELWRLQHSILSHNIALHRQMNYLESVIRYVLNCFQAKNRNELFRGNK